MRIRDGFTLRKIGNTDRVVPVGNYTADFDEMISLEGTKSFLWKILKEGTSFPVMVELLMKYYSFTMVQAQKDIESFLIQLKSANMLEYDKNDISKCE